MRGETVLSLNQQEAARLARQLDERRGDLARHLATVRREAARLAGYEPLAEKTPAAVFSGRYQRSGYSVEKHLLPVDERYAIPLLAMVPGARTPSRVVLYLHPDGKAAAAQAGGEMEWLVQQGCAVVAPDLSGTGELGPGFLLEGNDGAHGPFKQWYGYVAMGKSIVGRQMRDVMRTLQFIEEHFGVARADVDGVSRGAFAPLLLHTAAIEGVCDRVALLEPLLSYRSLVATRRYPVAYLASAVPSALTAYDLPDLAACLTSGKLLLSDPCEGSGARADPTLIEQETAVVARAFSAAGKRAEFVVVRSSEGKSLHQALATWLE